MTVDCTRIQQDLYAYLATEIDPYDFQIFLEEFARDNGIDNIDDDSCVSDLTDAQLEQFKEWLVDNNKPEEYIREDPMFAPAYLMFSVNEKLPKGSWLIHFTNASDVHTFDRGATLESLALSTWRVNKSFVDCKQNLTEDVSLFETVFGFAFEADRRNVLHHGRKYGRNAVLFQTDCAVSAYHYGDEEDQAIFPLCSEYNVTFLYNVQNGLEHDDKEFESLVELIAYLE